MGAPTNYRPSHRVSSLCGDECEPCRDAKALARDTNQQINMLKQLLHEERTARAAVERQHAEEIAELTRQRDHASKCEADHMMADYERIEALRSTVEQQAKEVTRLRTALEDAVDTIIGWHKGSIGSIGNVYVGSFGVEHLKRLRAALTQTPDGENS